jgi:hypothetical protein
LESRSEQAAQDAVGPGVMKYPVTQLVQTPPEQLAQCGTLEQVDAVVEVPLVVETCVVVVGTCVVVVETCVVVVETCVVVVVSSVVDAVVEVPLVVETCVVVVVSSI